MNYKSILFAPLLSILSFSAYAETNWSDMGEYWEPSLPKLILALKDEWKSCEKDSKGRILQPCYSKTLKGAKFLHEGFLDEIILSFDDPDLFVTAKNILESAALKEDQIRVDSPFCPTLHTKEYILTANTDGSKLIIHFKNCFSQFSTLQAHKEDPINTWVSISGMTPGRTTEKDFINWMAEKAFFNYRRSDLMPPDFNEKSPFLFWHTACYELNGSFWGLPREIRSVVMFGDYNLIDIIDIYCEWDRSLFDQLSEKLSEKYAIEYRSQGDLLGDSISFKPKSESCKKYNCPSIVISKEDSVLRIFLFGDQSYIGYGNYFQRWHKERQRLYEKSIDIFD
jgi:hypothetical protein